MTTKTKHAKYREITKLTPVTKEEAVATLKRRMPCAEEEDIAPFVDTLYGDKKALCFDELLEAAFANTVVPFA